MTSAESITVTTITIQPTLNNATHTHTHTHTPFFSWYSLLLLCTCLLLCISGVYGVPGDAQLSAVQVQLSRSPNAKCVDGTPAAYYWKQGASVGGIDGTNTWLIALDDAFAMETTTIPPPWIPACVSTATCIWRQTYYPPYVTTVATGTKRTLGGIFSTSSTNNPQFANSNLALIHYCSNDLWLGSTGNISINVSTTWVFRGMSIVDGVIDDLINRFPAISTSRAEILFIGSGFGGLGLSTLLDRLCLRFPTAARCVGVLDGGVYIQPNVVVYTGIADYVRIAWPIWQPRLTNTSCMTKNPFYPTQPHTCAIAPTSLLYHTTPFFIFQSLSDFTAMQLTGFIYDTSTDGTMQSLANLIYQSVCALSGNMKTGYYAPSCSVHSFLFSTPIFTTSFFSNSLPGTTLSNFFRSKSSISLINPPYSCNSICINLAGTSPRTPRCDMNAVAQCIGNMTGPTSIPMGTIPPIIPPFNNIVAIGHAIIRPVTTAGVTGNVLIEQDGTTGLSRLTFHTSNLMPQPGGYGVYITTWGDSSNIPTSVGDHYNPTNMLHGCMVGTPRHVGDIGVILNSTLMNTLTPPNEIILYSELLTMSTSQSIIGRSIIITSTPCNMDINNILAVGIIGIGNPGTGTNIAVQQIFENAHITAYTRLFNSAGTEVGTFRFSQPFGGRVRITGNLTGFPPSTQHGMHIHTYGDVTNGLVIGSHYNPTGQPHGLPPANRESGDLGNIMINSSGVAIIDTDIGTDFISLYLPSSGIIGRTIAFDALPDTGVVLNGVPSAWGVIGLSSVSSILSSTGMSPSSTGTMYSSIPINSSTASPTSSPTSNTTLGIKHIIFLGTASHGWSMSWWGWLFMAIGWYMQWLEVAYFLI